MPWPRLEKETEEGKEKKTKQKNKNKQINFQLLEFLFSHNIANLLYLTLLVEFSSFQGKKRL